MLLAYGYVMAVLSGAVTVMMLWGRKIVGYWNGDSEATVSGPVSY
ncbi:MAG: hypothetical protein ABSB29_00345 [Nitrososphaerales archaeon]